jgi:hypothetical protein
MRVLMAEIIESRSAIVWLESAENSVISIKNNYRILRNLSLSSPGAHVDALILHELVTWERSTRHIYLRQIPY